MMIFDTLSALSCEKCYSRGIKMQLSLDELRECFDLMLARLRASGVDKVDTGNQDLYWSVLPDDWLKFDEQPTPAVGSLDDDLTGLAALLDEPSRLSVCDFDRLASVLKFLVVLGDSGASMGSDED
jgi:hypothetical protein